MHKDTYNINTDLTGYNKGNKLKWSVKLGKFPDRGRNYFKKGCQSGHFEPNTQK